MDVMKQQVFKGKMLTRTVIKNNIHRIYKLAGDEFGTLDWYEKANRIALSMADLYLGGTSEANFNIACGVIAALSPRKRWEDNLRLAKEFMLHSNMSGHTKVFIDKAADILSSNGSEEKILEILNGNKIVSFYLNIRYPSHGSVVTIDRHALSIALGMVTTEEDYSGMTTNQYEFFEQCYVWAAYKLNIRPSLLQSITWEYWRKYKSNYK